MKIKNGWVFGLIMICTALFFSIAAANAVIQQPDATLLDRDGFVIGTLKANARVLLISQGESLSNVLISGWVDNRFLPSESARAEVEDLENFFFGGISFQDLFGNSSRMIGILENFSNACYSLMNMEASLWDVDGNLRHVAPFRIWQVPPGARIPFQSDRIFVTVEETEELLLRLRFLSGNGCESSGGGGGGGGSPSDF